MTFTFVLLPRDAKILELLYEEAQWNMRSARYPCELSDYEMLAGIQSRLELGPYDHTTHTPSFFRYCFSYQTYHMLSF